MQSYKIIALLLLIHIYDEHSKNNKPNQKAFVDIIRNEYSNWNRECYFDKYV